MRKKMIKISLDEDTQDFLELARLGEAAASISDFINSLLRQERFRQGYAAYKKPGIPHMPNMPAIEKAMLLRSGLLPLLPKPRR